MSRRSPRTGIDGPWRDVVNSPRLLAASWRDHRASGSRTRDFRSYTTWKVGPACDESGPYLISVTRYTPYRITDVPGIWRAADRLGDELAELDGAVGAMTYLQPWRRRIGSLSAWTDTDGLAAFMRLPYHVEIMREYRPRGLPLRSAKWWSDSFEVGPALAEGHRLLDEHDERRVTVDES